MDERKIERWNQVFYRLGYVDLRDGLGISGSSVDYRRSRRPNGLFGRFKTRKAIELAYGTTVMVGALIAALVWGF